MNHGRKFAFAFLLLSILMLPRFAAAQAKQPAILQIQNSGTTAGTAANYFKINFTTGCTTTFSNGVFSIACTGGAGNPGGSANQIQYNNAGTSFGAFTMTGDCSIVVATGVITCTASNGTPFASGAFAAAYSLPAATSSTLGGVKPDGTTLSNTSGAIAVNYSSTTYFPFQSITTTGTSGAATLSGGVLNIPQYPGSGLSGMTATQIPVAATASTITSSIATTNPTYFPFQSLTTTGSSGAATLTAGVLNIPSYTSTSPGSPGLAIQGSNSGVTGLVAIPGTVFNATNGITNLAIAGPNPWYDVKAPEWGATGNGSTDDSAAVNSAIAACNGGTVFFGPGTYLITANQINLGTSCTLLGVGAASVIEKGGNFDLILGNTTNIYIRNLTLIGQSATYTGRAINLNSTVTGFAVTDNTFKDFAGAAIYGTSASQGVIDRNYIVDSPLAGGIFMENSTTHVNVTNNYIDGTLWTGSNNKDIAFHTTSNNKQLSSIIIAHNNLVVGAEGMAIEIGAFPSGGSFPTYPTDIVVSDNECFVDVTNAEECYSLTEMDNATITGNTADINGLSASISCFEVLDLNDSTFTGNTCADSVTGSAMSFQGVNFSTITGNHLNTFKAANGNGFYFSLPQAANTITACSTTGPSMAFTISGTLNASILPGAYIFVTGNASTGYNTPSGILWKVTAVTASTVTATNSITTPSGTSCAGTLGLGTVGNTITGNEIIFPSNASGTLYGLRMDCSLDAGTSCSGNTIANNEFIGTSFSGETGLYVAGLTGSQADANSIGTNSFRNLGVGMLIGSGSGGNLPTNTFIAPQVMTNVTTPLTASAGALAESFLPALFAKFGACASGLQGNYGFVTDSTTNTNGGTVTGGGSNAVGMICNGTNWVVTSGTGSGGPGTGTQYTHSYWSTTSALGSVAPTTGYDGVPQVETNSTTAGAFTAAPVSAPQGVPVDIESGSTFTVALTDRYKVLNTTNGTTSTAVTVPAPSTTGFGLNFVFAHLNSGSVVATDTPTTATVNGNSTMKLVGAVAGHNPEAAFWWEDSSTSCSSGPCYWGAEILPTDANGQLAAEGLNVANACPTCVVASSPGVGIAHFAGSTQTVTSSTIATGDIAANAVTLAKLATQTANTVLANVTGSTAVPTAAAIPAGVQFYTAATGYSAATAAQLGTVLNIASGLVLYSGGTAAAPVGSTDWSASATTLTSAAAGTLNMSASTGAPSVQLPAVVGGTILAGTSTANLSAPVVIQNTNSSNNNTSITMGVSSPGTSTGQTTLNVNCATTQGNCLEAGTGGTWTAGVLSGQTKVFQVLPTGQTTLGTGPTVAGSPTSAFIIGTTGTCPTAQSSAGFLCPSSSSDNTYYWNVNNASVSQHLPQTAITSGAAYTNATTGFTSVVGGSGQTLAFTVAASTNYAVTCNILWQGSAGTTGPKFQWTGPASPTAVTASMHSPVTTATYLDATATAFSSPMADTGTITTATNFNAVVTLGLVNGTTAGTVTLQAAANGTGTLTIEPGSFCEIQ